MTNKTLVTIVTDNRLVADTIATAVGATSSMTTTISATDMP